jgi:hypothetical protein
MSSISMDKSTPTDIKKQYLVRKKTIVLCLSISVEVNLLGAI